MGSYLETESAALIPTGLMLTSEITRQDTVNNFKNLFTLYTPYKIIYIIYT